MNLDEIAIIAGTLLSGAGVGGVLVKYLNRGVDGATAEQRLAEARKSDVDNLRNIIAEVRESEARKATRIDNLEARLDKLEERERHMLTRAAVHEAWDQLALQWIIAQDGGSDFPPPPPLVLTSEPEHHTHGDTTYQETL